MVGKTDMDAPYSHRYGCRPQGVSLSLLSECDWSVQ
jgi:hypothetical protein